MTLLDQAVPDAVYDDMVIAAPDEELVQIPAGQFAGLMSALEHERERSDHRAPFKRGGYGMFNRRWMWNWAEQDGRLDAWLRVALYCWTHHGPDGHCVIKGDFGPIVLGKNMSNSNANKKITAAVQAGVLGQGSNPRCLVAPWGVRYRTTADVWSNCDLHG